MNTYALSFEGALGREICATLYHSDGSTPSPTIVILHGFKGFKDWGFFPLLCERLADAGLSALAINFSHNGIGGHGVDFYDMDGFERNTYGLMLNDLAQTLRCIGGELPLADTSEAAPEGWAGNNSIGVFGHSMGGGVATLGAHLAPETFKAGVLWNPVGACDRFSPEQHSELKRLGYINIPNARTGQLMRVGQAFFDDLDKHKQQRDILGAAKALQLPFLVVQGSQDEAVPPQESRALADGARNAELLEIADAGHTFNAGHPLTDTPEALEHAINATVSFFKCHLV